jgi:hypothetical protein
MTHINASPSRMLILAVPMEVNFEQTNTVPRENPLFRGVWRDGFNWDSPQRFIAGYRALIRPAPARSGTCASSPGRRPAKLSASGRKLPLGPRTSAPNAKQSWRWPKPVKSTSSSSPNSLAGVARCSTCSTRYRTFRLGTFPSSPRPVCSSTCATRKAN